MEFGVGSCSARCEGSTNRKALSRRSFQGGEDVSTDVGEKFQGEIHTCQTKGKVLMSVINNANIVSFHAKFKCRKSSRSTVMSEGKKL